MLVTKILTYPLMVRWKSRKRIHRTPIKSVASCGKFMNAFMRSSFHFSVHNGNRARRRLRIDNNQCGVHAVDWVKWLLQSIVSITSRCGRSFDIENILANLYARRIMQHPEEWKDSFINSKLVPFVMSFPRKYRYVRVTTSAELLSLQRVSFRYWMTCNSFSSALYACWACPLEDFIDSFHQNYD